MKVWYKIEVQMLGENERTIELDEELGLKLGFTETDIDERELYQMTALFTSKESPEKMKEHVRSFLQSHPEVFYIDVTYRWDSENVPDRFVVWGDGRSQEYTGHIVFEEDK